MKLTLFKYYQLAEKIIKNYNNYLNYNFRKQIRNKEQLDENEH